MRLKIRNLKENEQDHLGTLVTVKGWVRTFRDQKKFAFIELYDGSCLSGLQIVADGSLKGFEEMVKQLSTGASLSVTGKLVASPGKGQSVEIHAESWELLGTCDPETYALQKKRHSFEFLRTIAHLRPRTNTFGAITRVRSRLAHATHCFFQDRGFLYVHTPIITASDCEGAGEMFRVTTLNKPVQDYADDFFSKEAFLTVSGQLNGEIYACALSDIYTFGPTFRAENSNTSRHLAEFWMIEPEMAFADLNDNMDCAEAYVKYLLKDVLAHCHEDMTLFDQFIDKGIISRLEAILNSSFKRISYTEAVEILSKATRTFEFPVAWGKDLQSEHERYLTEDHFNSPVIVYNYPKEIKSFYMRANEDGKTVAAMDVLMPKIGELIGGSQREERFDVLQEKIIAMGLDPKHYWWYLDLRRYGTVPHAGFGLGFERMVLFVTGMENIRDVIPFPRYPGHADF